MIKRIVFATGALFFTACTHSTHLVHVGDFDPTYASYARGELVTAESEQFVVLGFAEDTKYVDKAFAHLKASCPGSIQGIQTEYSTDHGFFSWTNRIRLQGLCVRRS